jgi:hypothetical protein
VRVAVAYIEDFLVPDAATGNVADFAKREAYLRDDLLAIKR